VPSSGTRLTDVAAIRSKSVSTGARRAVKVTLAPRWAAEHGGGDGVVAGETGGGDAVLHGVERRRRCDGGADFLEGELADVGEGFGDWGVLEGDERDDDIA